MGPCRGRPDGAANWAILTLPYTEDAGLAKTYVSQQGTTALYVSSPQNAQFRATRRPVFLCPSDAYYNSQPYQPASSNSGAGPNWARGNYASNGSIVQPDLSLTIGGVTFTGNPPHAYPFLGPGSAGWAAAGYRGAMGINEASAMKDITDGAAHTCLLGEIRRGLLCGPPRHLGHGRCRLEPAVRALRQRRPRPELHSAAFRYF